MHMTDEYSLNISTRNSPGDETPKHYILPKRDYVTFGYLLSQIRLSVVCNVHAPYSAS